MIGAIETRYSGYRFRSRLEARWATFFDHLGCEWEYEKEGYVLPNGDRYLPGAPGNHNCMCSRASCTLRIPGPQALDLHGDAMTRWSVLYECDRFGRRMS